MNHLFNSKASLYECGFRPFFLLAASYTLLLMLYAVLLHSASPSSNVWFMHELIFGSGSAVIAGFLLTAFPAWTDTERVAGKRLILLVVLWVSARVLGGMLPMLGVLPMQLMNVAFSLLLLSVLICPILDNRQARHRIFYYYLALYFSGAFVSYFFWIEDDLDLTRQWLIASGGVFVILMMIVFSRMSMVIVNHALERFDVTDQRHLARPPRRNFAIGTIVLFLAVNLWMPESSVSGWLALACTCAILNILNDWHLPKAWRDPYYQAGYAFYLLLAAGFGVIGTSHIWEASISGSALLILFAETAAIAVLVIMLVVGQKHTGYPLQYSPSIRLMLAAMPVAVTLQLGEVLYVIPPKILHALPVILIALSFTFYLVSFWSKLTRIRVDGKSG
ncbi:putative NnrS protein [Vibrio nigripulchritudo SO65]|uniref:NnrS family protein n=1 Tax=Vibrio nigripulchritudo TaxID=28173 RepID=UPI0003B1B481|nr:NnrS family protein [Vibrio nigripulchritudo]CCN33922.1 putative NnrS protein [Vibrio nigripulchritudo AM115]CCN43760.1 putative NnrS protein [Vibrio nigripulchritudo FTn2]CCN65202.1 putative NnrS protein [Vibrio nigripulchritudo POn4]CCN79006.1 putative NnrS protein [Vibrio nigripulchritudo SO65]